MKITILNENTVYKRGLQAEHGLSLVIEANNHRFLFDTGQSNVYVHNAKYLKEDFENIDGVILSHGHYDHCGGVDYLPENITAPIYIRKGALQHKMAGDFAKSVYRDIGITWRKTPPSQLVQISEPKYELAKDLYLLGDIPYTVDFEKKPEGFFIEQDGKYFPDVMSDEQMLVIREERGLFVFLGCSHPGIINALHYVQMSFPQERIYGVFAGMHLIHANTARLEATYKELQSMELEVLIPVHCTGPRAIAELQKRMPEQCIRVETGKIINI